MDRDHTSNFDNSFKVISKSFPSVKNKTFALAIVDGAFLVEVVVDVVVFSQYSGPDPQKGL